MDLAAQQKQLLALIKMRDVPLPESGDYITNAAQSRGLRALREIDHFWKEYSLLNRCPFTAGLMKQEGTLQPAIEDFIRNEVQSAFVEELSRQFLDRVARMGGLRATLAKFELALNATAEGNETEYRQHWDQDPYYVLGRLLEGKPVNPDESRGRYSTLVSSKFPDRFRVVRLDG